MTYKVTYHNHLGSGIEYSNFPEELAIELRRHGFTVEIEAV